MHPALTAAALLVAEGDEVIFIGTPGGLEARLVPEAGLEFRGLSASGFDRSRPWTLVTSSLRILLSAVRASNWLGVLRPDVVVGFGGYVSIPVGLAAVSRRIPLVLHEQNSIPGLANRFLSRWASAVAVTYEESESRFTHPERAVLTGNPVRPAIMAVTRAEGRASLGLAEDATVLLAFGGSRGARHLNTALIAQRDRLMGTRDVVVLHVAGVAEAGDVRMSLDAAGGDEGGRWRVLDYLDDMPSALAACDVVVSRAGATTIAEVTARGVAAILVPYPFATDDHQTKNARAIAEAGGAIVIADAELDEPRFGESLETLLVDVGARANMAAASRAAGRPDAGERVVAVARAAAHHIER